MKKEGLIWLLCGVIAGMVGSAAVRKLQNMKMLPEDWFNCEEWLHW
ncbi:MAG: hypothetical protein IKN71_08500 [Alphaproteobacteria bacterium]|nr:hypothetical protein [Alphaproteobacteria bacterium]